MSLKKRLFAIIYIILLFLCIRFIINEIEGLTLETIVSEYLFNIWTISSFYITWLCFEVSSLYNIVDRKISWIKLLRIYLIGEAYNCLTPLMGYGGDPVRIHYLQKEISMSAAGHSIVLFKYIDIVAAFTIGLFAQFIAYNSIDGLPDTWSRIMFVSIILYSVFTALFLLGLFKNAANNLSTFILKIFKINLEQQKFTTAQKARSYLLQCCSRIFVAIEISLACTLLSYQLPFTELVFVLSFSSLSTVYFFFIPNGIGSNEVLLSQSTELLGYGSALGFFVALTRRIRSISWAVIGLFIHLITVIIERSTDDK